MSTLAPFVKYLSLWSWSSHKLQSVQLEAVWAGPKSQCVINCYKVFYKLPFEGVTFSWPKQNHLLPRKSAAQRALDPLHVPLSVPSLKKSQHRQAHALQAPNDNNLPWKKEAKKNLKVVRSFGISAPTGWVLSNYRGGTYKVLNRYQWRSLCSHEIWEPDFWSPIGTDHLPA